MFHLSSKLKLLEKVDIHYFCIILHWFMGCMAHWVIVGRASTSFKYSLFVYKWTTFGLMWRSNISSQDWMDSSPTQLPLLAHLFFCHITILILFLYSSDFLLFYTMFKKEVLRHTSVRGNAVMPQGVRPCLRSKGVQLLQMKHTLFVAVFQASMRGQSNVTMTGDFGDRDNSLNYSISLRDRRY